MVRFLLIFSVDENGWGLNTAIFSIQPSFHFSIIVWPTPFVANPRSFFPGHSVITTFSRHLFTETIQWRLDGMEKSNYSYIFLTRKHFSVFLVTFRATRNSLFQALSQYHWRRGKDHRSKRQTAVKVFRETTFFPLPFFGRPLFAHYKSPRAWYRSDWRPRTAEGLASLFTDLLDLTSSGQKALPKGWKGPHT